MTLNTLKNYAKAVYANKYTLTGYMAAASSIAIFASTKHEFSLPHYDEICSFIGHTFSSIDNIVVALSASYASVTLWKSKFGKHTYRKYLRTKSYYAENGVLPNYATDKKILKFYCSR